MKKELFIYSISIGINRGAVLLYLPLLVHSLSLADYGEFSYVQILFQLVFPLLCLNIASGIAREGAEDAEKGLFIYKKSYPYVIGATIISAVFAFLVGKVVDYQLLVFIVLLGGLEALHNMLLNLFRVYEKHSLYAMFTISKTIGFLALIYGFTWFSTIDLHLTLFIQVFWHFFVFAIFSLICIVKLNYENLKKVPLKPVLVFSIFLIPHIVSQWLMGASNRVIVKSILGADAMGAYSISYTVSMVLLLLQSGLAVILPQNFIKNPELWLGSKFKAKFFMFYTLACIGIYLMMLVFFYINKLYMPVIKYGDYPVLFYTTILTAAFYVLGYYYYYSNILFFHKKSKWISFATMSVALFSIAMCYFMTKYFGIVGASFSMLLTYIFYYGMVFFLAAKIEVRLSFNLFSDLILPLVTVVTMILMSYYFSNHYLKELVIR